MQRARRAFGIGGLDGGRQRPQQQQQHSPCGGRPSRHPHTLPSAAPLQPTRPHGQHNGIEEAGSGEEREKRQRREEGKRQKVRAMTHTSVLSISDHKKQHTSVKYRLFSKRQSSAKSLFLSSRKISNAARASLVIFPVSRLPPLPSPPLSPLDLSLSGFETSRKTWPSGCLRATTSSRGARGRAGWAGCCRRGEI